LGHGNKEVLPITFRTDGNRKEWRWEGFDAPRPLFNLNLLIRFPTANVVIVEGEKTAEHTQSYLDPKTTVVTCWIGGANGVHKTDFSPLENRNVILCPDNDAQGLSAMLHIKSIIKAKVCRILPLDATLPKGWDFADVKWEASDLKNFIKSRMVDNIPPNAGEKWEFQQIGGGSVYIFGPDKNGWGFKEIKQAQPEPPALPEKPANTPPTAIVGTENDTNDLPFFRFMGYEKNESGTQSFIFYVFRSNQLVRLSPSGMTKSNLLLLAPLNWWEMNYPGQKTKFDTDAAANHLIEESIQSGIFNPDMTRGRGAWMDGQDVVIHTGAKLIVNGSDRAFNGYRTRFIYEASQDLGIELGKPASNTDGKKLLDLFGLLNWEKPINSYLLAGWCVIAPICGALKWRPHIWITGAAGSGKTWIFNNLLKRLLGETGVCVEGSTTEAGLRNYLKADALPVLFDEAEGEDRNARERIQNILNMMRGSSTSNGNMILKADTSGGYNKYVIKTCFAYCSIGISLSQQADRSRVTVLSVNKVDGESGKARFEAINRAYSELITDETIQSIQSRTVAMLPTILANSNTFSAAAATVLGDQRSGDQVGAMLAGAYSLVSSKKINFDEAIEWIKTKDWTDENKSSQNADEVRLITHLMEMVTTIDIERMRVERTIGELVNIAKLPSFIEIENGIKTDEAKLRLNTLGFRVDIESDCLLVSNTSQFIKTALRDTPWASNHIQILKRLEGAKTTDSTTFGSQMKSRAVSIPLKTIFG
jgi:putative DNA primase/helicase